MATTNNLGLLLVDSSQAQQDVIVNEALADLDAKLTESTNVAATNGTNTLTAAQVRGNARVVLTAGTASAAFDVVLPSVKGCLILRNSTSHAATVKCTGGSLTVAVAAGAGALIYCDGADAYGVSGGGAGGEIGFTSLADTPANYSGAGGKLLAVNSGATAVEFVNKPLQMIPVACSDETTALTAGVAKVTFEMPYAFALAEVRASVTAAPTGAPLQVDINENAVSILSTKITIDAGEKSSKTAATPPVISDTVLADGAEITIDIDQVGSTVAGAGLKVYLIGRPT